MALEKLCVCVCACVWMCVCECVRSLHCFVVLTVYDICLPRRVLSPSESSWHSGVICPNSRRPLPLLTHTDTHTHPLLPPSPTLGACSQILKWDFSLHPSTPLSRTFGGWKLGTFLFLPAADGLRFGKQQRPSRTSKPILLSFETNLYRSPGCFFETLPRLHTASVRRVSITASVAHPLSRL